LDEGFIVIRNLEKISSDPNVCLICSSKAGSSSNARGKDQFSSILSKASRSSVRVLKEIQLMSDSSGTMRGTLGGTMRGILSDILFETIRSRKNK